MSQAIITDQLVSTPVADFCRAQGVRVIQARPDALRPSEAKSDALVLRAIQMRHGGVALRDADKSEEPLCRIIVTDVDH